MYRSFINRDRNMALQNIFIIILLLFLIYPLYACTIFVFVDNDSVLFCNNEDSSNPITRIWFQPAGEDFMGCGYVGLDNGWPQGGLNSAGLCFDWVAGFHEKWEKSNQQKYARMYPCQRMLETCKTIKEAIQYYNTYW